MKGLAFEPILHVFLGDRHDIQPGPLTMLKTLEKL